MKQIDKTVSDLCNEVDYWKEQANYYYELYEKEKKENIEHSNERLADAKKGVANALMFALAVREDGNGNLVTPKEDRNQLAKGYETD